MMVIFWALEAPQMSFGSQNGGFRPCSVDSNHFQAGKMARKKSQKVLLGVRLTSFTSDLIKTTSISASFKVAVHQLIFN
jgi:hypothetical protein